MTSLRCATAYTLAYLLLAGGWVLGSDLALQALIGDVQQLAHYQRYKGLGFVLFSSLLLLALLLLHENIQRRLRRDLRASRERLDLALDAAQEGLWDWDLGSQQVFFSPGYSAMLGYAQAHFGNTRQAWQTRLHPADLRAACSRLERLLSGEERRYEATYRMRHADGSYRWIFSRGHLLVDEQGKPQRFIGTARDITQRRADEESLRQAAAVFDSTQEGVLVTDTEQRIVHVNPAFTRITGYSESEVLGQTPRLLKSGRHGMEFYQSLQQALEKRGSWSGEVWNRRKNGEIYPQWQSIRSVFDENGLTSHYVAVFSDISALKRSQSELDHMAHYDPLCQLPNRLLFSERTRQALERCQRENSHAAVLLLDLDHFKYINESFSHTFGDQLLKEVAMRLLGSLRAGMTLARLGGDEFGVLVEDNIQAAGAALLARQLIAELSQPFELQGQRISISASFGISLFPGDAENVEQVLRNADSALSKAKGSGRETYSFYSQELTEQAQHRIELVAALQLALQSNQLCLHYQPLHDLDSGARLGVEALVRWQHPQRGLVPPGEFIPVAEDSGLIGSIDAWVLEHACQQMCQWQAEGVAPAFIAVNVSSRLFSRGSLDQRVAQVLQRTGLAPHCLELEVTESAVMDDPDQALQMLQRLRALGVQLAIDDFGTGYSSLQRLKNLPVHKLKIDQSFIRGLPEDADDAAIASAVIALGRSLGLKVVAEGVETTGQRLFLQQLGCDIGQGYLFSRPLPASQLVNSADVAHCTR